ncbi:MAG: hypothetical protein RDA78_06115 [Roseibium sp.]|uniref:hypothetical protein n=1 Tax=Roseibium sp. TaxID=1936156 RepID=UPI003D9C3869
MDLKVDALFQVRCYHDFLDHGLYQCEKLVAIGWLDEGHVDCRHGLKGGQQSMRNISFRNHLKFQGLP